MKKEIQELKDIIIKTLDDNKAEKLLVIDTQDSSAIADCIIIANGTSNRHVLTLKEKVITEAKKIYAGDYLFEGDDSSNWIIIDFQHIIVHLFREEVRNYYDFDALFSNKKTTLQ